MNFTKYFLRSPKLNINRKPKFLLISSTIISLIFIAMAVYVLFYYRPHWTEHGDIMLRNIASQDSVQLSTDVDLLAHFDKEEAIPLKILIPEKADYIYNTARIHSVEGNPQKGKYVYRIFLEEKVDTITAQKVLSGKVYYKDKTENSLYEVVLD